MNNKEFINTLAQRTGQKSAEVQKMTNDMIAAMSECFMEGSDIQLANFGTFELKKKMERVMVNPTTGQRMLVPPKLVLAFKPHPAWKDSIKKKGNE
ncbi:MAG: HU family DNA-binding protein [Prevotella sp.]|nr:HU family DNA-binding protein [Prevotella sp.]